MADFQRPENKHWAKHGVYPGQVFPGNIWDSRIVPMYAVATLEPGFRNVVKGEWDVSNSDVSPTVEGLASAVRLYTDGVENGKFAAVAVVCLTAHSLPGSEGDETTTVLSMTIGETLRPGGPDDPLPGMENLHNAVVAACRTVSGADSDQYRRPETDPIDADDKAEHDADRAAEAELGGESAPTA